MIHRIRKQGGSSMGDMSSSPGRTDEQQSLLAAAADGNLEVLRRLLTPESHVNTVDSLGQSPLFHALAGGHQDCARLLLAHPHIDLGLRDKRGWGCLHVAARAGLIDICLELQKKGQNPFEMHMDGTTPLHYLMRAPQVAGQTESVESILRYCVASGVTLNFKNAQGETLLHHAVLGGRVSNVRLLAELVDINTVNLKGETALHWAAMMHHVDIARFLLHRGADPDMRSLDRQVTPGELLSQAGIDVATLRSEPLPLESARSTSISTSTSPSSASTSTPTAAAAAAAAASGTSASPSPSSDPLLQHHSAPTSYSSSAAAAAAAPSHYQTSPLAPSSSPASSSSIPTIPSGTTTATTTTSTTTTTTTTTTTPSTGRHERKGSRKKATLVEMFFSAVKANDVTRVMAMVESGADPNLRDANGQTALHVAITEGFVDLAQALIATPQCDPNVADSNGWTPLHCASEESQLDIVEALLDNERCDVNAATLEGNTPLHYLCRHINLDNHDMYEALLEVFLSRGASLASPNMNGETALHQACITGKEYTVKLLLTHGADKVLNLPTNKGETALHYAVQSRNAAAVSLLMENGADKDFSVGGKMSPLDIALKLNLPQISNVILGEEERRRVLVVQEILETERSYLADLRLLNSKFRIPLREQRLITDEECGVLFPLTCELLDVHMSIMRNFDEQIKTIPFTSPDFPLARLLLAELPRMEPLYKEYASHQDKALLLVEKLRLRTDFVTFLTKLKADRELRKLDIISFLLKPVQRVCKYPLLFRELLKQTLDSHPTHGELLRAHEEFSNLTEVVNAFKRSKENFLKVEAAQRSFVEQIDMYADGRILLFEGKLLKRPKAGFASKGPLPPPRTYFLFTDVLVCATKNRKDQFTYAGHITLNLVQECTDLVDSPSPNMRHAIQLVLRSSRPSFASTSPLPTERAERGSLTIPTKKVILQAEDAMGKVVWIRQLTDALNELKKLPEEARQIDLRIFEQLDVLHAINKVTGLSPESFNLRHCHLLRESEFVLLEPEMVRYHGMVFSDRLVFCLPVERNGKRILEMKHMFAFELLLLRPGPDPSVPTLLLSRSDDPTHQVVMWGVSVPVRDALFRDLSRFAAERLALVAWMGLNPATTPVSLAMGDVAKRRGAGGSSFFAKAGSLFLRRDHDDQRRTGSRDSLSRSSTRRGPVEGTEPRPGSVSSLNDAVAGNE